MTELTEIINESDADPRNKKLKDDRLKSIIDRIINLEEQKKEIGQDIADIFKEAKSNGYDGKAIREVIKLSKMDTNERDEREYLVSAYKQIMGI